MGTVADVICDVCEESSRYSAPFLDVTLSAERAIGRKGTPHPPLAAEDADPLLVALATRGVVHGTNGEGRPVISHSITCGGCCFARLLTTDGRAAILASLEAQGKLGTVQDEPAMSS